MEGDKDNGYHSNDNEFEDESGEHRDVMENSMLEDLRYDVDENVLAEPDYDAVRKERFQRNQNVMKRFNAHIANATVYSNELVTHSIEENAAIFIQKHVRGFLAQRKYIEMLVEQFEKEEKLRREKTLEQVEEAKLLIENHQLEVQFEDYNVIRRNKAQRLAYYVIIIQRAWRKYMSGKFHKNNDKSMLEGNEEWNEKEFTVTESDTIASHIVENAINNAISQLTLKTFL